MGEFEVGQLAQDLYTGYMAYHASAYALDQPVIAQATVAALVAANRGPAAVPTGYIHRRDGSNIVYDVTHAIADIRATTAYQDLYDRLWLAGALLTLGDSLAEDVPTVVEVR